MKNPSVAGDVGLLSSRRKVVQMWLKTRTNWPIVLMVVLAFSGLRGNAQALEAIEGQMRCIVLSQRATLVTDGTVESFRGVSGGFSVGDELALVYRAYPGSRTSTEFSFNWRLLFGLGDRQIMAGNGAPPGGWGMSQVDHPDGHTFTELFYNGPFDRAIISENSFSVEPFGFGDHLRLVRYSGGNWNGVGMRVIPPFEPSVALHVFSLDCFHAEDRLADVIESLL